MPMAYHSARPAPAKGVALRGRDVRVPPYAPGMRIGLFGGTFDPPHEAHLAASLLAMRRLGLDRVWWLVTPGNPLKDTAGLAPLAERIAAARALAHHPRIDVTGFEAEIGVRYSYDTIRYLVTRCAGVRFVWIMGADNLRHFHRWNNWRGIAEAVPIVVVDRLGPSLYAGAGAAGKALAHARLPEHKASLLPSRRPPAWVFLHGLKSPLSSTMLRARRRVEPAADTSADAHHDGANPLGAPAHETMPHEAMPHAPGDDEMERPRHAGERKLRQRIGGG
ncbi:nicotinate-nucleotide adenylyltransferase [Rhodovulum sp. PH10]|uniref:nicotinate-nucleotide adenylyltransferase n=1 Tax=Rhodovulum sp. PH10 TaxID=1187851 RepID=UPI001ED92129|nr:nicotinate-nucleotide adenylyltransferase [Rhodovulum sp. PH10]